jgi:hypothetical protein
VSDQRLSGRGSVVSFVLMTGWSPRPRRGSFVLLDPRAQLFWVQRWEALAGVRSLAVRGRLKDSDADAVLGDDALALVASARAGSRRPSTRGQAPKMKITLSFVSSSSTFYLQATHVPRASGGPLVTDW